jgi:hypothetical protein
MAVDSTALDFSARAVPVDRHDPYAGIGDEGTSANALDYSDFADPVDILDAGTTGARALAGSGGVLMDALNGLFDPGAAVRRALGGPDEIHDLAANADAYSKIQPNEIPADRLALAAGDIGGLPGGALEGVENLGSTMLSLPAVGLGGIGTALGNAAGLTDAKPADVIGELEEALTYQPRTAVGQDVAGAAALPFELLAKGGRFAGEHVQDATGSPAAATAIDTLIQALPMVLGARGKGGAELPRDAITPDLVDAFMRENPAPAALPPGSGAAAEAPRAAAPDITDAEFRDVPRLPDESGQLALPPPEAAGPRELAPPVVSVDPLGNARTSADLMGEMLDALRAQQERGDLGLTPDTERAIAAHAARADDPIAEQRSDDSPPWWLAGQMAEHELASNVAQPELPPRDVTHINQPPPPAPSATPDAPPEVVGRAAATPNSLRYNPEQLGGRTSTLPGDLSEGRGRNEPQAESAQPIAERPVDSLEPIDDKPDPPLDIRYGKPRLPAKDALARAERTRDEPLASEAAVSELSDADLTPDERAAFERQSAPRELSSEDLTPAERASFERQQAAPAERGAERELTTQMSEESRARGAEDADRGGLRAAVDEVLAGAEGAPKVDFVRDEDGLPEGARLQSHGGKPVRREGLYDPNTKQVHILTDNVTTPERAAWVAAHEIAGHHGLRGLIGERALADGRPAREALDSALDIARQNPTVAKLADAIRGQRNLHDRLSTEEAIAEIAAAARTGNWDHLRDRYGVDAPEGVRNGAKTAIARFVERIKALLAKLFKKSRFSDADVHKLVEDMWQYVRKPREKSVHGSMRDGSESRATPHAEPKESMRESAAEPREESLESVAADSTDIPKPKREAEAPSRRPGESQRDYARRVMRTGKESIAEATKLAKHQQKIGRANFRAMLAKQARAMDVADATFAEARKLFDETPEKINLATIDQWERGEPIVDADAKQFFSDMKAAFDQRIERIRELDPSALQSLIENYFPHMWEDSSKAAKWYQGFTAKRPLEGNKSFLKQRTWGTIKEGMASGLKPVSTNPVDLALLKLSQMDKFIAFHEFRDDLKARGWLKEMEAGAREPEGYKRVDDPAFAKAAGLAGYYAVPELIAKDVNNYLAPSLYRFGAWKSLRAVQNTLMSYRLGMSLFHAGFTTLDNLVMHVDVGARRFMDGDIAGGLSTLLKAPLSVGISPFEGGVLNKEWRGLRDADPNTRAILHMVELGGARYKMSPTDYNNAIPKVMRAVRQAIANRDVPSAGSVLPQLLPALGEASALFVHHWLVPNQKMAARVMLAKFELDRLAGALGKKRGDYAGIIDAMHPDVVKQIAGKVVDVVDDRLGQMTYDNQFWNKTAREVAQSVIGAVGWQVGTLRTVFGGAADLPKLFRPEELVASLDRTGSVTSENMGRVSGRLTYLITLGLLMGSLGAITQYLLTGKKPTEIKDYFFPRTGRRNWDDSEERLQYPSYWMDHYKLATHPLETAKHKLHPSISMLMEALSNQDYYGAEIRDPEAPWQTQAKEIGEYVAKGFLPYSLNNQSKLAESDSGAGQRAANFIGVTTAPSDVTRSTFQAFLADISHGKAPKGAKSAADAAHSQKTYEIEDALRHGESPDQSELTAKERKRVNKDAQSEVPELRYKYLTFEQKIEGFEIATSEERERYHLRRLLGATDPTKSDLFMRKPVEERSALLARRRRLLGLEPPVGDEGDDE